MTSESNDLYDVLVVGGGPAGLSAALALGRARKRVLLVDAGPRRNAAATHVHNFLTRDGTPPDEMRRIGRAQLAHYPNVEARDVGVRSVAGAKGAFEIVLADAIVRARRVLLATGMIDEPLAIDGFAALWGRSIFQCPYCHGWEVQGGRWGFFAQHPEAPHTVPFATMLRGWSDDVTVFTNGAALAPDALAKLDDAGVRVETGRIARFVEGARGLASLMLEDGREVPCDALFAHPAQRQVEAVKALGLALDDDGMVKIDPMMRETSIPGIYAAGDLATRAQGAILAAAAGMQAAAAINMELTAALVIEARKVARANDAQTTCWNEQAGPKWVRRQEELDAQLEPVGAAIIEKLALKRGERVLDVGCGAGATTLAIADLVRPGGVTGLDVSVPLLGRADERSRGLENVRFVHADAQTHDFEQARGLEQARFDVVFSRFGVMFFDDPVRAFRNLRAALAPRGRLGFVCWRSAAENPLFTLPLEAAAAFVDPASQVPAPEAPGPFAFADASRVRAFLEAAGFVEIEITPHDVDVVYAGSRDPDAAAELALEIGPLGRALATIDPAQHAEVRAAVRRAFERHVTPRGVILPTATWLVTARRD